VQTTAASKFAPRLRVVQVGRCMTEDTQPNERPLSRKGAAIPIVYSAHRKAPFTAGTGNHYPTTTNFSRTPAASTSNPQSGTYNSNLYEHRRHNYHHDVWQAKRRRMERESGPRNVDSGHPRTSYPKARKFRKTEPTELLIDVPPECRKGAHGCQKLRKQWVAHQIKEIQTSIGVKVQFCGYLNNSARFTCANDQSPVGSVVICGLFCSSIIGVNLSKFASASSHLPADVGSQPDSDMQEEIIISDYLIHIDGELGEVVHKHPSLSDGEQVRSIHL
jgi:hypothetical protein